MKLVVDENIAFATNAFEQFGDVLLLKGRDITNSVLEDVDILIVRSITKVDETLLINTSVKFVGTATIGTDHIDIDYLNENNIAFSDAKGCNADSVAEYFLAALMKIAVEHNITLKERSIGIIGVGNIGSRIARISEALGMNVLKNDPPRERAGDGEGYVSLEQALKADIITFHVPLNKSGIDKTYHLMDSKKINLLNPGSIIINTSRGPVIDNIALLNKIEDKNLTVCLDVWEGEPLINIELLKLVKIASPHIAGYSFEGKVNGTRMMYNALCDYTGHHCNWKPELPDVKNNEIFLPGNGSIEEKLHFIINKIYNIDKDNKKLKKIINMNAEAAGSYFDELRKDYSLRREFNNYNVIINREDANLGDMLRKLRFNVEINN
ncbi:MAG: 4-phosphoerythronate dehydrogenase [Ignavibacteria bacterium]|jgi:erythronate-4-phosphate dehydrogenase